MLLLPLLHRNLLIELAGVMIVYAMMWGIPNTPHLTKTTSDL